MGVLLKDVLIYVHIISCTRKTLSSHIVCMLVTMHAICWALIPILKKSIYMSDNIWLMQEHFTTFFTNFSPLRWYLHSGILGGNLHFFRCLYIHSWNPPPYQRRGGGEGGGRTLQKLSHLGRFKIFC